MCIADDATNATRLRFVITNMNVGYGYMPTTTSTLAAHTSTTHIHFAQQPRTRAMPNATCNTVRWYTTAIAATRNTRFARFTPYGPHDYGRAHDCTHTRTRARISRTLRQLHDNGRRSLWYRSTNAHARNIAWSYPINSACHNVVVVYQLWNMNEFHQIKRVVEHAYVAATHTRWLGNQPTDITQPRTTLLNTNNDNLMLTNAATNVDRYGFT